MVKTPLENYFKILFLFLVLLVVSNRSYATCIYTGGYPWQPNGCLTAADLNSAFALAYQPPSVLAAGAAVANLGYQPMDPGQNLNDLNNKTTAMNNLIGYIPLSVTANLNDLSNKGQALLNLKAAAQVPNNATLVLNAISVFPQGVFRSSVSILGDAPPLYFYGQLGTCVANSMTSNIGQCNDAVDGNSWRAVYPTGMLDVREFGAKHDGVTDDTSAFQTTIAASISTGACVYIPYSSTGYVTSAPLTYAGAGGKNLCLTGDPLNTAQNIIGQQRNLILTTNTDCVDTNGARVSIYNISCAGNGSTSLSSTKTVCINASALNGGYDTLIENVTCSGYVVGFRPIDRTRGTNWTIDNSGLYPNLVNDFPSTCVESTATGNVTEIVHVIGLYCRDQGFESSKEFLGDGSTTYADFTMSAVSGRVGQASVLWSSDGVSACQGVVANGSRLPCVRLVPGTDFTLYDCGVSACGGSGGTLLPVHVLKAATVANNPQIMVADTTGLSAGIQYKVIGEHNLLMPTYVVSVDDGTHVTLSNAPTSTNAAVKYTFIKVGIGANCTGALPTCAYNLEARFTTAPPNNTNVEILTIDPWSYNGILETNGAESRYDVSMMGGIRNIFQTGCTLCYGNTQVNVAYWELGQYCMVVNEGTGGTFGAPTNNIVRVGRNVSGQPGGSNWRCAKWLTPTGYGNQLIWNGSDWTKYESTNFLGAGGVSLSIGSDTAPISSTAAKLEISLANLKCSGGSSNFELQASEDGLSVLGGTSYSYILSNQIPTDTTYVPLKNTGTNAIPLSFNNLNTAGAYNGYLTVTAPGLSAPHPVAIQVAMTDSAGNTRSIMGAGSINGTSQKLKALQLSCGSSNTQPLLGSLWYREVW